MVVAACGHLTLVKLFVDFYHADDAPIAPDVQLALRLAVEGGCGVLAGEERDGGGEGGGCIIRLR